MKGTNLLLLSDDTILEAIEEYLNRHHSKGVPLSVDSWGIQQFNGKEWCVCEVVENPNGAEVDK